MMLHKTLREEIYFMKSWEPSKNIRSPQEWGGLWKRERERKPLGGERISIVRCALSPPKEVVARTPVDGSCVTHTVKQIEQHTSPQDIGKRSCVKTARRASKTTHKKLVTNSRAAKPPQYLTPLSIGAIIIFVCSDAARLYCTGVLLCNFSVQYRQKIEAAPQNPHHK